MITRIWHGMTKAMHAEVYLKYLEETGIAAYKETPGNISVQILRRIEKNKCHFWTVTQWKDLESIIGFAGEDYELAKYYPDDEQYLLEQEEKVIHCETFTY